MSWCECPSDEESMFQQMNSLLGPKNSLFRWRWQNDTARAVSALCWALSRPTLMTLRRRRSDALPQLGAGDAAAAVKIGACDRNHEGKVRHATLHNHRLAQLNVAH